MAAPSTAEARVLALIDTVADQLSPDSVAIAREMVENDEPRLALSLLGDLLIAPGVTVPPEATSEFRLLAAQLGGSVHVADHFRAPAPRGRSVLVRAAGSERLNAPETTSLCLSLVSIGTRMLVPGVVVGTIVGLRFGWAAVGVVAAAALAMWLLLPSRRIEIDRKAVTLVPMLPFDEPRRFPFAELGPFRTKAAPARFPFGSVEADVVARRPDEPEEAFLKITAYYARSPGHAALSLYELRELLDHYREGNVLGDAMVD
jgi:hypothetical protein